MYLLTISNEFKGVLTHMFIMNTRFRNLYYRDSIYAQSVYKLRRLPASIREHNNKEPNFFSSK